MGGRRVVPLSQAARSDRAPGHASPTRQFAAEARLGHARSQMQIGGGADILDA
jgi:hypothetical protein